MTRSEYTANVALQSQPVVASWLKPSTCNRRLTTIEQRVLKQMISNARNAK